MVAAFIVTIPQIEIVGGLVEVATKDGAFYWRPGDFRRFVESGQRKLDLFEVSRHEPPALRTIK